MIFSSNTLNTIWNFLFLLVSGHIFVFLNLEQGIHWVATGDNLNFDDYHSHIRVAPQFAYFSQSK